ncbi:hypothetical protein [Paenibacillus sp. 481]|uniref:hypothetical protein n=1 Tax=Paenibacillus sp. 481 TaxID=2835869 RepID=UPI001E5191AC|nr:hypothetical protein [Paenibacillus sp. 481]UHA72080.1 hypothetical protein KIK04_15355 [Paenibacillus sp. 481]
MKKFIAGFVAGGLLFGTVAAFAQDLKNVLFDISSVQVDGVEVNMKSSNKPFTFNGYAYIPSYMLPDMGYVATRSQDKSGVVLRSVGQAYYPISEDAKIAEANVIPVKTILNSHAFVNVQYKSKELLEDDQKKPYENYIHISLDNNRDSASYSDITIHLDEKFRRFGAKAQLLKQASDAKLNGAVTVSAYVVNDRNQETLVKSWTLDDNRLSEDMTLSLRYAKSVRFKVTTTHKGQIKFALLNPTIVK